VILLLIIVFLESTSPGGPREGKSSKPAKTAAAREIGGDGVPAVRVGHQDSPRRNPRPSRSGCAGMIQRTRPHSRKNDLRAARQQTVGPSMRAESAIGVPWLRMRMPSRRSSRSPARLQVTSEHANRSMSMCKGNARYSAEAGDHTGSG
jgi:hypothetical protein